MDPQPEDVRSNKTDQHRLTLDSWRERGGEKQTEGTQICGLWCLSLCLLQHVTAIDMSMFVIGFHVPAWDVCNVPIWCDLLGSIEAAKQLGEHNHMCIGLWPLEPNFSFLLLVRFSLVSLRFAWEWNGMKSVPVPLWNLSTRVSHERPTFPNWWSRWIRG